MYFARQELDGPQAGLELVMLRGLRASGSNSRDTKARND
jgi:hypothetical protein